MFMAHPRTEKRAISACLRFINHAHARGLSTTAGALRRDDRAMRLAIIGSGPAGFYTAYRVMSRIPEARVDMYESLPVPFGLVRHGVAPDHPEVKNCQDKFEEVASSPNFKFLGNVSIGLPGLASDHCTVQLKSLKRHYHAILFAYGASEDRKLGIPGESTLAGIYSARQFVGWYNGLPECAHLDPNLRGQEAVVIGQGNVALDVARMLLENVDVLKRTDITEQALAKLAQSRIKRVHVVGRRGPMQVGLVWDWKSDTGVSILRLTERRDQATFTIKEVRELMKLPGVAFHPVMRSLIPKDITTLSRASKRLMEVLLKGSSEPLSTASKSWSLDSCLSPRAFISDARNPSLVAGTEFQMTNLGAPFDPKSPVKPSGETRTLPSDVVFRSIGYKSVPLPGFAEAGIQFDDDRGIMKNDGLGRVTRLVYHDSPATADTQRLSGMYCAGWVKRGPTGVIASTMQDAFTTGDTIIEDWLSGAEFLSALTNWQSASGWDAVKQDIGSTAARAVTWSQWRQIDKAEKDRGRAKGKEREKFTRIEDMLAVID